MTELCKTREILLRIPRDRTSISRVALRSRAGLARAVAFGYILLAALGYCQSVPANHSQVNVVLVHGAFADGSSWAKVIPLLEDKGLSCGRAEPTFVVGRRCRSNKAGDRRPGRAGDSGGTLLGGNGHQRGRQRPKGCGARLYLSTGPDSGQSLSDILRPYGASPGTAETKPDAAGFLLDEP